MKGILVATASMLLIAGTPGIAQDDEQDSQLKRLRQMVEKVTQQMSQLQKQIEELRSNADQRFKEFEKGLRQKVEEFAPKFKVETPDLKSFKVPMPCPYADECPHCRELNDERMKEWKEKFKGIEKKFHGEEGDEDYFEFSVPKHKEGMEEKEPPKKEPQAKKVKLCEECTDNLCDECYETRASGKVCKKCMKMLCESCRKKVTIRKD